MNKKSGIALLALVSVLVAGCLQTTTDRVREKSPNEAAKYNALLGIEYLRTGDLAKAKDKIEKALQFDARVPVAQTAAGMLYERLGQMDKADKHFRDAIRLEPDDPEMLNHYGVFLCRQSKTKEGEQMIVKAARNPLYPMPYLAYTNAGLCMKGVGKSQEAEQYFEQAVKLRPRYPRALAELAQLNFARGGNLEARDFVERYLKATRVLPEPDPELPNVLLLGVRVEKALGNASGAAVYGHRLRTEFPRSDQTRALLNSERSSG